MTGGGFFRDSIVLASGATGTGKTLMVTEFMSRGCDDDERCLLFAFEEGRIAIPAGEITIHGDHLVQDTGEPDDADPTAVQHDVQDLPLFKGVGFPIAA